MVNGRTFDFLGGVPLRELSFLGARLLHLDYTGMGRFSDIEVGPEEAERLARIHRFYTRRMPLPVTVIHGIAPRSGTNYILDLLRVHPDARFLPEALPEIPFLSVARDAMALQGQFLQRYEGNRRSMGRLDFLSHITHGAMLCPHEEALGESLDPDRNMNGATSGAGRAEGAGGRVALFKVPHVHHLNLFPLLHPGYRPIICVRDGRDVVASASRTWAGRGLGRRSFRDYVREWARSARIVTAAIESFEAAGFPFRLVRYEDAFAAPYETARSLAEFAGLDPGKLDESHYRAMRVRGSSQGGKQGAIDWAQDNIVRDASFNPVGRWRRDWSGRQKRIFDRLAGRELALLGYDGGETP